MMKFIKRLVCSHQITRMVVVPISGYEKYTVKTIDICINCGKKIKRKYN